MKRDLPHVVSQVFNTPLMMHGDKLDTVLAAVGARILAGQELEHGASPQVVEPYFAADAHDAPRFGSGGYLAGEGVAILPILGTLVRRGSYLDAMSGMTSYASLASSISEMMASPSVRGIILEIDSYGGEAGGVFALARLMTNASRDNDKPIWAIVNETAASAGYALACAAEQIWLPQMGAVGSIGVVTAHIDLSKADAQAGVKWTYIYAGEHKKDGNSHEPLPATALARAQADINDIYSKFVGLVAESRGISADAVRDTKADMYRAERAVKAGLADKVGTFREALSAFVDYLDGDRKAVGDKAASRTMAAPVPSWDHSLARAAERYGLPAPKMETEGSPAPAVAAVAETEWEASYARVAARLGR
jgi:signal peptide peptidase SppA